MTKENSPEKSGLNILLYSSVYKKETTIYIILTSIQNLTHLDKMKPLCKPHSWENTLSLAAWNPVLQCEGLILRKEVKLLCCA